MTHVSDIFVNSFKSAKIITPPSSSPSPLPPPPPLLAPLPSLHTKDALYVMYYNPPLTVFVSTMKAHGRVNVAL